MRWFAYAAVPLPRSIFTETSEKYPPTRMYSQAEVLQIVGDVMNKFADNDLEVLVSANLMLLGGILIVVGRKCQVDKQTNASGVLNKK
jgi:hypothetical protein